MDSIRIEDDIRLVAARVRALGSGRVIVNQMARRIRQAVPPVRKAVKVNAIGYLPKRGGLNRWTARTSVTAAVRRGARSAGVAIRAGRGAKGRRSDIRRMDLGQTRHPSWGHRPWVAQAVRPGFVTQAVQGPGVDAFRGAIVDAVEAAKIEVGL